MCLVHGWLRDFFYLGTQEIKVLVNVYCFLKIAQACDLSYLGGLGSSVAGSKSAWAKLKCKKGLLAVFAV